MGLIWVDNVDPNAEVGSYQMIWVDNLDPFWLYQFPRPKNVWVDIFKTNGTTPTNQSNNEYYVWNDIVVPNLYLFFSKSFM